MKYVGTRVTRREDPALLRGVGRFVADQTPSGALHAVFVRSTIGHGKINSIDATSARAAPGVHAVYTGDDLPRVAPDAVMPLHTPNPAIRVARTQPLLAVDEVCYAGQTVAVVIADSPYLAEDAAELVVVDYEDLGAVAGIDAAQAAEASTHSDVPDNIAARLTVGFGDTDAAFAAADHVVATQLRPHRGGAHPMECRGVVATSTEPDRISVVSATQAPYLVKRSIMDTLGLGAHQVRVVAPADVGGGFGPKAMVYPEEIVVPAAALALGRPVKWIEDRREHFIATTQERDQLWDVELALTADGRMLGLRGTMAHDSGAYLPWGIIMPYISATTVPGPYDFDAYSLEVTCYFTNAVATTPVRGAGRPQAVFAVERLLDFAADELGIDRAEIRRRNLVPAEKMPYEVGLTYRDGSPVVYDSGDYPATLEAGLERAGYANFAERQRVARGEGRLIGLGMAFYVEGTGLGPFEGADVKVEQDGKVVVHTGAAPQGQSHQTVFAQIAADELGVDIADVTVITGDTDGVRLGIGTFASRIAVTAGSSVHVAAGEVRQKLLELAAALLEANPDDIELRDGTARVAGAGESATVLTYSDLARLTQGMPGFALPQGITAGLFAESYFTPPRSTYAHGFHVAEVEVDPELGSVRILKYVVVHDCGRVLNPMVVDGQIQGGLAHGIGNALLEVASFDENAQPSAATFADYLLPEALDVPVADVVHLESPTDLNPLGIKGAGEGGTIPAAAAIVAAIEDAVREYTSLRLRHHPLTPAFLHQLLHQATDTDAVPAMGAPR